MAFIPVVDTAHVRIEGSVDSQETINDLYFRRTTGAITSADLLALVNAMETWVEDNLAPQLNEAWSGRKVVGRDLTLVNGFVAEASLTGIVGGIAGEAAPNNCTIAVSFRTALSGRNYRGRNYVPVLTNSQVTGNLVDSGWALTIAGVYQELLFPSTVLPDGWIWVVVSRFIDNLPRLTGVFTEIQSVVFTDLVVDSQRRRLPGRGK